MNNTWLERWRTFANRSKKGISSQVKIYQSGTFRGEGGYASSVFEPRYPQNNEAKKQGDRGLTRFSQSFDFFFDEVLDAVPLSLSSLALRSLVVLPRFFIFFPVLASFPFLTLTVAPCRVSSLVKAVLALKTGKSLALKT